MEKWEKNLTENQPHLKTECTATKAKRRNGFNQVTKTSKYGNSTHFLKILFWL